MNMINNGQQINETSSRHPDQNSQKQGHSLSPQSNLSNNDTVDQDKLTNNERVLTEEVKDYKLDKNLSSPEEKHRNNVTSGQGNPNNLS